MRSFCVGGKEAFYSNQLLVAIMQAVLAQNDIHPGAIQFVDDISREVVQEMMRLNDYLDVLIPRGGRWSDSKREKACDGPCN